MILLVILAVLAAAILIFALHDRQFTAQTEARYPPQGKFITVDGVTLHYVEKGAGEPVILLHGDGGSSYDFTLSPLFDQLAEKYRVLAFDRPGLGYSQRPAREGWSPRVQARLIHQAARQLGIRKPVVVGHSRGGAVLFAWALEYPYHLAGAVGLAPAAFPGSIPAYRVFSIPILGDLLYYALVYPLERFGLTNITKQSLETAFAPDRPAPPDYVSAYFSLWLRRRHALAALGDLAYGGELTAAMAARYHEISLPFVVVSGLGDRNVPAEWARRLEKINPHYKAILIPDTGHELIFNCPEEVGKAVDLAWELAALQATTPRREQQ